MDGPFASSSFRRLFAGRVITNFGDSFYFIAAMWLVYDLTEDPLLSGVAGFLTLAPSALQFLFGPLVDRWPLRATLTGTQLVQAGIVLVVPVADHLGLLTVGLILTVMPALSLLNQFVYPAQTAALPRIVDDEDLVVANAAFAVAYQGVDSVANAVGGIIIAVVGGVTLFLVDSVTFLAAALLFATVVIPRAETGDDDGNREPGAAGEAIAREPDTDTETGTYDMARPLDAYRERLSEGFGIVRGTFLFWLVIGATVTNFAGGLRLAAMPAYADHLGASGLPAILQDGGAYGVLLGCFAAGQLIGAISSKFVADQPLGTISVVGFAASGAGWVVAVAVDWLPVTAALLLFAHVPQGIVNVQLTAVVQSAVPDGLVGRVSSVLASATAAAVPVGSLVGGALAGSVDAYTAMMVGAFAPLFLAVYVLSLRSLRTLPAVNRVDLSVEGY